MNKGWKPPGVCRVRDSKRERPVIKGSHVRSHAVHQTEHVEDFFTVVATGNVGTVRQFLKKHRKPDGSLDFDVNSVNFQNGNAMSVAVEKGNLEMVKCLAQVMRVTKNSILVQAVHKGDLDMVKCLCETLDCEEPECETEYPSYVTPLMAAAIEGHYEIVGYMIERGYEIREPHQPACMCRESCKTALLKSDPLYLATSTLYMYSAIGSPAYIPYVTADPIHYCFRLHRRLKILSEMDSSFRHCYNSLASKVSIFASSLVAECRSSKEVEIILNQRYGGAKTPSELPRIQMAIDFNQREFICNPKVQMYVQQKFYGSYGDWPYQSKYCQISVIVLRMIMLPMVYISFLVNPKSQTSKNYAAPVNKMINFLAMHFVFLGLLFMETRTPKPWEHMYEMSSVWSLFIFLYFYGFVGLVAYQILTVGFRRFLKSWWNLYDLTMITMFSLFVTFSISSLAHVRMSQITCTERKQWNRFDPQLMAEGFLVIATLMAYLKTLFFFQASQVLGQLQVTLCLVTQRLLWFCLFGVVALLGFSLSLSHFYSYYSGMSYTDPETQAKSTQEESFTDVVSTFKTFFWGFFGQSSASAGDVVLETENEHVFTQAVGYVCLAAFFVLMILVFKSMLILMAVSSIHKDVHQTWLFRRTQFFLYFIDSPLLPPPFNILPHRYSAASKDADLETATSHSDSEEYKELAKTLVERYFTTDLRNKRRSGSTLPQNKFEEADVCQSRCRSM